MVYTVLAGLVSAIALIAVVLAARMLFRRHWLLAWLRGCSGMLLLVAALLLGFAALDFYSYRQYAQEKAIANLSFSKLDSKRYRVSLVEIGSEEQFYELAGDMWQLDVRLLKWQGVLARLGVLPGYRLDRISGRYFSLEEEQQAERTVYGLGSSKSWLDVWRWLKEQGGLAGVLDASYGSATYVPMADGALFSVNITATGLVARPLNERAKLAIDSWP